TYDWSFLMLNVNPDGKVTPNVDREYVLNPGTPGVYYLIEFGIRTQSGICNDSKGRGAIRYIKTADEKLIRVDTYLIPLAEISRHMGNKLRLAYWSFSPKPPLTVNSTGYTRSGKDYNRWNIPLSQYNEYVLAKGGEIDVTQVPEGRNDVSLSTSVPKVGEVAPEISAKEWINLKKTPTLADLRGKVIIVDFWATWCGPCIECIPHLNELQRKYSGKNFQLLSFVAEGHQTMDSFLTKRQIEYPIGLESSSLESYGITGIPHAFVIDQNGKIAWQGDSASSEMDQVITKLLPTETK
ncbi:MAG: TlpA disulfide reductase family protein, partial [Verrucomicrobiota bacterium]